MINRKMTLYAKCDACKTWHKKTCTFRGKNGKRFCAACTPSDTFYSVIRDETDDPFSLLN